MKPLGAFGCRAPPPRSVPSGLCFLIEESQDFNLTLFRNALDSQLLVVGRWKKAQSDFKSRKLHHQ